MNEFTRGDVIAPEDVQMIYLGSRETIPSYLTLLVKDNGYMRLSDNEMVELEKGVKYVRVYSMVIKPKPVVVNEALLKRNSDIELLEAYSIFLEKEGYMDTDWRTEEPFAIGEFLNQRK